MAQLTYPGVYVEEVSSGVRPIAAASTSIAAFIGTAEKGPIGEALKVFNFTEYQGTFGRFLNSSFLSHAVFQFFNNGGSQCYIIRVTGANTETANIALRDRGTTPQVSFTISAISPGRWGNEIDVVVADGTNDPGNEFNLFVYFQGESTPVETFENLTMVSGTSNFVETATASSQYISVTANLANTNVQAGTSRGGAAPIALDGTGRTSLAVNLNNDSYQQVDVQGGVGAGTEQAADLANAANIATAIQFVVRQLTRIRASTDQGAFDAFACTVDSGNLLLTSGVQSLASSVNVAPAADSAQDATGLLNLGTLQGGTETLGASVTRPLSSPSTAPADAYRVGDHNLPVPGVESVQAGTDGDVITNDVPYIAAFQALNSRTDVSLIAVPGVGSPAVVAEGMNYSANRSLSDCFFIGDMAQDDETVEEAITFRNAIATPNSYGAVYLPWIRMLDPTGTSTEPILVPPSGYVAGLYAKTDAKRGVWKAPAGTEASLGGAAGLAIDFTDVQQGNLNPTPTNVNVIRSFTGSGIVLWGARTVTSDPEWTYIPVRRVAIFLRVSIYRGIQWAVFEPNDEDLWASLRLNISAFMMTLFRQGAFQGSTPSDAFFVKVDNETTTQADIDLGIVNILIGFAPLKPAEYVVVKISQKAGQTS